MKFLKSLYRQYLLLKDQFGWNIPALIYRMVNFVLEYVRYKTLENNPAFGISALYWYPCLKDKTIITPLDPVYFYQDAWAAGKIFKNRPVHHYDVGSSAKTIAIISQFVPTTMVDIRPIELELENLSFKKGSILELPFEDNSIDSISSLCVVEHIGLGRYGDPLDQYGSEKAIKELIRVTRKGGFMYFSVPVDVRSIVFFNGHRTFNKEYLYSLFVDCSLVEERFIVDGRLQWQFHQSKGYSVGLFLFQKIQ